VPDVAQLGDAFATADGAVAGGVVEGAVDEVVTLSGSGRICRGSPSCAWHARS
jgi:hypothetical protein